MYFLFYLLFFSLVFVFYKLNEIRGHAFKNVTLSLFCPSTTAVGIKYIIS